ncbi:MAG TPA: hypothetical protein VFM21_02385 [Terriglobia bacterium]|nr:hypothetical protein [Terriglobia bacterium]
MAKRVSAQFIVALGIIFIGGGLVGGEFFLVKWYPAHKERVAEEVLTPMPYRNDGMGLTIQVAQGLYGKLENFPGGVKFSRFSFLGVGPSLTITGQPNPDKAFEFDPHLLAKWQTLGVEQDIPRYNFQRTDINKRDGALIWQQKGHFMWLTAHVISPDRIVEASCSPGRSDETLFLKACEQSLRSIQLDGAFPPEQNPSDQIIDISPRQKK